MDKYILGKDVPQFRDVTGVLRRDARARKYAEQPSNPAT
jgi:hypothetical protein